MPHTWWIGIGIQWRVISCEVTVACHAGVALQDLHAYDPATKAWTNLSIPASGTPPGIRGSHAFQSVGGKLYVHGGNGVGLSNPGPYEGECIAPPKELQIDSARHWKSA